MKTFEDEHGEYIILGVEKIYLADINNGTVKIEVKK
jgi:hypothetical protein